MMFLCCQKTRILLQFLLPVFIGCEKFEKNPVNSGRCSRLGDLLPTLAVSHGVFDGPKIPVLDVSECVGFLSVQTREAVEIVEKKTEIQLKFLIQLSDPTDFGWFRSNMVQQDLDQRQRWTFPDRNEMFIMTQTT